MRIHHAFQFKTITGLTNLIEFKSGAKIPGGFFPSLEESDSRKSFLSPSPPSSPYFVQLFS